MRSRIWTDKSEWKYGAMTCPSSKVTWPNGNSRLTVQSSHLFVRRGRVDGRQCEMVARCDELVGRSSHVAASASRLADESSELVDWKCDLFGRCDHVFARKYSRVTAGMMMWRDGAIICPHSTVGWPRGTVICPL